MLEQWKMCVDKGKVFGALLIDLAKAFDFLDHRLLTHSHIECLQLDYLSDRNQRIKIENTYST